METTKLSLKPKRNIIRYTISCKIFTWRTIITICVKCSSTTSTLLVKFGILQYLSNTSSNELLMIGIAPVKNSAKPTIFGTGDSENLWKVVHLIISVPHYRNVAHLKLKFHQEEQVYIMIDIIIKIRNRVIGRKMI